VLGLGRSTFFQKDYPMLGHSIFFPFGGMINVAFQRRKKCSVLLLVKVVVVGQCID
jgi:hypothetical protein